MNFLTKICSACGKKKPLSLFSVTQAAHNIQYSNICNTCKNLTEEESQRTSVGGARIGNTEKQKQSRVVTENIKETKEKYYADRTKEHTTKNKKEILQTEKTNEAMKHRKNFFSQSATQHAKNATPISHTPTRETEIQPEGGMQIPQDRFLKGETVAKYAALIGESSPLAKMLGKSKFSRLFEKSIEKFAKQVETKEDVHTDKEQNEALLQLNKISKRSK